MKIKFYLLLFCCLLSFGHLFAKIDHPFPAPSTMPSFITWPKVNSTDIEPAQHYKFDTLSDQWKPFPILYPTLFNLLQLKTASFDPVGGAAIVKYVNPSIGLNQPGGLIGFFRNPNGY